MTTILADSDFNNVWLVAGIAAVIGSLYMGAGRGTSDANMQRLTFEVRDLQKKLDALLKQQGIEIAPASDLSPGLQMMAKDPRQKIAAIKLYRDEHPGVGLAEAKQRIEQFSETGR